MYHWFFSVKPLDFRYQKYARGQVDCYIGIIGLYFIITGKGVNITMDIKSYGKTASARRARTAISPLSWVAEYKAQFDFAGDKVTAKDLCPGLTDIPVVDKIRISHQK